MSTYFSSRPIEYFRFENLRRHFADSSRYIEKQSEKKDGQVLPATTTTDVVSARYAHVEYQEDVIQIPRLRAMRDRTVREIFSHRCYITSSVAKDDFIEENF
ncbi:hypothetical protein U1Q18_052307 [Sarracenia purpurea var. burkii]